MNKEKIIEIVWFAIIVSLFLLSIKMIRNGELEVQVASFGILAPLVLVLLKATTLVIAPLGGSPLYIIAGALFGTIKGFILSLAGDILGSVLCFMIGRKYGPKIVKIFAGEKHFGQIMHTVSMLGDTKSFLKARIALVAIPELVAYAAGLSNIRFIKFVWLHSFLYIPVDFVFVFLGDQIATLSAKYLFILYGGIALVTLVGFWFLYRDYEKMEGM